MGRLETNVILAGEITPEAATLYGYITNFFTPQRVIVIAGTGRQRHASKTNSTPKKITGSGWSTFSRRNQSAKNFYTMMQAAQILWALVSHGYWKRVYEWAKQPQTKAWPAPPGKVGSSAAAARPATSGQIRFASRRSKALRSQPDPVNLQHTRASRLEPYPAH